ncbi:hypothetical protein HanRHA438_Chr11g0515961 [Helianthus annuus]|nr:hypothetical protein HanRHA438_Chr11g0515961 [Helianthus annuus]
MFSSLEMNKWYWYQISQTDSIFGTDSVLKFSVSCTGFYLQISVNTGYFHYQYPFFFFFGFLVLVGTKLNHARHLYKICSTIGLIFSYTQAHLLNQQSNLFKSCALLMHAF